MERFRQARVERPLSLFEMDREQAQTERDRMADEHPEATWLVAARADYADDPRTRQVQNAPYGNF